MLLSAVSVLVVAQSSSEIPEGLMNNPVYVRPSGESLTNCVALQWVEVGGALSYLQTFGCTAPRP